MAYDLNIRGWMSEMELKVIEQLAQLVPENETIIEIGSMMGRTAFCWAATNPTATVICFDQWVGEDSGDSNLSNEVGSPIKGDHNTLELFIKNTSELKNVIPIRAIAPEFPIIDNSPFLVFIDTAHKNPCDWDTIQYWLPKIKKGGILCGHDFSEQFPDVVENVERLEKLLSKKVTTYKNTSLWSFTI